MKLITRDTDYAIRALCFIAKQKEGIVSVTELVQELDMPRSFLRKILQILHRENILKAYKGIGGGFALNLLPQKILIADLIEIFQGQFKLNECIFRKKPCPNMKTCKFKKIIDKTQYNFIKEFKKIKLSHLLE